MSPHIKLSGNFVLEPKVKEGACQEMKLKIKAGSSYFYTMKTTYLGYTEGLSQSNKDKLTNILRAWQKSKEISGIKKKQTIKNSKLKLEK